MRLTHDDAMTRLDRHDHGVLSTVHPDRGVDAVPVVYATNDGHLGIPIDLVKPKTATRLQRERNLESDPRATLLIDEWDKEDWSKLWWVRTELRWLAPDKPGHDAAAVTLADGLAARYSQYTERPFARVLVFTIENITGWAATDPSDR